MLRLQDLFYYRFLVCIKQPLSLAQTDVVFGRNRCRV